MYRQSIFLLFLFGLYGGGCWAQPQFPSSSGLSAQQLKRSPSPIVSEGPQRPGSAIVDTFTLARNTDTSLQTSLFPAAPYSHAPDNLQEISPRCTAMFEFSFGAYFYNGILTVGLEGGGRETYKIADQMSVSADLRISVGIGGTLLNAKPVPALTWSLPVKLSFNYGLGAYPDVDEELGYFGSFGYGIVGAAGGMPDSDKPQTGRKAIGYYFSGGLKTKMTVGNFDRWALRAFFVLNTSSSSDEPPPPGHMYGLALTSRFY